MLLLVVAFRVIIESISKQAKLRLLYFFHIAGIYIYKKHIPQQDPTGDSLTLPRQGHSVEPMVLDIRGYRAG